MKVLWCWRCRMEIPMLDDDEWKLVRRAKEEGMPLVEAERRRRGVTPAEPLVLSSIVFESLRPMLEMYRVITGFAETNGNAVWHHVASKYGPPCPACGKPLRTPRARFCAACGHGMEEMIHHL